jgi:very-short-patch-repair endonuclease
MDSFIQKATKLNGDNFDYSKVDYKNSQTRVTITCKTCGDTFEQTPNNHLRGKGCRKCSYKLRGNKNRKTQEQVISEFKKIHIDENNNHIYEYDLVEYISTHNKVKIRCRIHGIFEQCPSDHLLGKGCNKCGKVRSAKKQTFTLNQFIERAKEKHGDNFNYSKVNYTNSQTPVIIICNTCGCEFTQVPNSHLQGYGCDKCAHQINHENQKLSEDEIIKRAKKVHGDDCDYPNINYINSQLPINIKCNQCNNTFQQLYTNHINQKQGCPYCSCRKTEKIFHDFLRSIYPSTVRQFKQEWCKDKHCLPYDECIPELKTIFELDGNQHFKQVMNWKSPEENQTTDKYKMKCANDNGYSLIRILQTDVLYDKYNWKDELVVNIEKIKKDNIVQNIYMCKNNEYQHFI